MRWSRFERRILLALGVAALAPWIGSLVFGGMALKEAYEVGVRPSVVRELRQGVQAYRAHILHLRESLSAAAEAVGRFESVRRSVASKERSEAGRALQEALSLYPDLIAIAVLDSSGAVFAEARSPRSEDGRLRKVSHDAPFTVGDATWTVRATLGADGELFTRFESAGRLADLFDFLVASGDFVSRQYLVGYLVALMTVIALVVVVVALFARRVTNRVSELAAAFRDVGAGDLDIEVEPRGSDEVAELTEAFNRMMRDLRVSRERIDYLQRVGAWQQFARRLAHEIKNPLTPIQLAVQEVSQSYDGQDAIHERKLMETRHIVEEEIATLRRLVGEFSEFARLPRAVLSEADLSEFVRDALGGLLKEAEQNPNLRVRVDLSEAPIPVRLDAMMMRRCLDNLLRNALRAVGGRTDPEVVVSTRSEANEGILEVRDNGAGVADEEKTRVFDPYFTTHPDGTGLGLAIVRKVVLEHGGDVRCTDAIEGGAAFLIRFPLDGEGGSQAKISRP